MRTLLFAVCFVASPAIAQEAAAPRVATAGEVIWDNTPPPSSHDELILEEPARGGGFFSSAGTVDVPAGAVLDYVETKRGRKACAREMVDVIISHTRACLVDSDNDGSFDQFSFNENAKLASLKKPAKYRVRHVFSEVRERLGKRIIYLGATPSTLNLSYREFSDDLARPAFTEDLAIPLLPSFPQDVRFKGLEMKIFSISGMGMSYSIKPVPRPD